MKIIHIFIRDLGGELQANTLLDAARSLGEGVPERTSNLYSDYFVASGLAPVRVRVRREEALVARVPVFMDVFMKIYSYGVLLVEYSLETTTIPENLSALFKAREIELPGPRIMDLEQLMGLDIEWAQRTLSKWLQNSYEAPAFTDKFHLFIDSESRDEDDAMQILLPGDESYSDSMKRRIVKRIEPAEENDRFFIMGNRGYLSSVIDPHDVVNFLELSRVQLHELKVFDYMLDRGIENTYNFLDKIPRHDKFLPLSWLSKDFQNQVNEVFKLTEMRMDLVDLVKDITNTSKVTSDPYFEILYRELNKIFHIDEWFQSVREKVDELEDIQRMILSRIDIFKSTTLEMTVIILILIEIIIPFAYLIIDYFRH
ncbi:MAG: hypothetical protein HQM08_23475 [Candidatus Riflebacteria bacterium]|nr:hypothetical protein [Candidatus Riflebacteria bacterium]